jgi:hypothetical protein
MVERHVEGCMERESRKTGRAVEKLKMLKMQRIPRIAIRSTFKEESGEDSCTTWSSSGVGSKLERGVRGCGCVRGCDCGCGCWCLHFWCLDLRQYFAQGSKE